MANYGFLGAGFNPAPQPYNPNDVNIPWSVETDDILANLPIISTITGAKNRYQNRLEQFAVDQAQKFESSSAQRAMDFEANQAELNRQYNSAEAAINREFNASEAEKQRQYQKEMESTKYQRAMDDMAAAGLNPILAYQGAGGSVSSGAQASGSPASSRSVASGRKAFASKAGYVSNDFGMDFIKAAIPFIMMGLSSAANVAKQSTEMERVASAVALNSSKTDLNREIIRKMTSKESKYYDSSRKYGTQGFDRL